MSIGSEVPVLLHSMFVFLLLTPWLTTELQKSKALIGYVPQRECDHGQSGSDSHEYLPW